MSLAQLGHQALGGSACALLGVCAILVDNRRRHERQNSPRVRRHDGGAQQLRRIGDGPIAVPPMSPRGTVQRLGRKRRWAIERHEVLAIKQRPRFQGCATLQWAQEALAHRAEPLGGDGGQDCAHGRVARDPRNPVEGVQSARGPLLVKSQERGRFEGKQGTGGPERIGSGHLDIAHTVRGKAGKTAVHQAKERISGERLTDGRCNDSHGTPWHENITLFKSGGIFVSGFTQGQCI